jgi:hypothetical protein
MGVMPPVTYGAHAMCYGDGVEVGGGGGLEPPVELLLQPSELMAEVVVVLGLVALSEVVLELV